MSTPKAFAAGLSVLQMLDVTLYDWRLSEGSQQLVAQDKHDAYIDWHMDTHEALWCHLCLKDGSIARIEADDGLAHSLIMEGDQAKIALSPLSAKTEDVVRFRFLDDVSVDPACSFISIGHRQLSLKEAACKESGYHSNRITLSLAGIRYCYDWSSGSINQTNLSRQPKEPVLSVFGAGHSSQKSGRQKGTGSRNNNVGQDNADKETSPPPERNGQGRRQNSNGGDGNHPNEHKEALKPADESDWIKRLERMLSILKGMNDQQMTVLIVQLSDRFTDESSFFRVARNMLADPLYPILYQEFTRYLSDKELIPILLNRLLLIEGGNIFEFEHFLANLDFADWEAFIDIVESFEFISADSDPLTSILASEPGYRSVSRVPEVVEPEIGIQTVEHLPISEAVNSSEVEYTPDQLDTPSIEALLARSPRSSLEIETHEAENDELVTSFRSVNTLERPLEK